MLVSVCLSRRERKKIKGAGWSSAVLVLAGWWGGRCQKASLDSKEDAVNSFLGSLSNLNTNTDVPLILV